MFGYGGCVFLGLFAVGGFGFRGLGLASFDCLSFCVLCLGFWVWVLVWILFSCGCYSVCWIGFVGYCGTPSGWNLGLLFANRLVGFWVYWFSGWC